MLSKPETFELVPGKWWKSDSLWKSSLDGKQTFTRDEFWNSSNLHIIKGNFSDLRVYNVNGQNYTFNKKALECIALPCETNVNSPAFRKITGALIVVIVQIDDVYYLVIPDDPTKGRVGLFGGNTDADDNVPWKSDGSIHEQLDLTETARRELLEESTIDIMNPSLIGGFIATYAKDIVGLKVEQITNCYYFLTNNTLGLSYDISSVSYTKFKNNEVEGIYLIPLNLLNSELKVGGKFISEHHLHFAIHAARKMLGLNIPLNELTNTTLTVSLF